MSYTVLARRYRSQTFDDVVGQEAVAQTLKNAIATNRVAHAYLFTGTRGVGKTTMARILAKALNCLSAEGPTTQPCCKCESCLAINEGEDIDVLEIDGASNTGVEHVRELRQNAIYRPARSRFKIYIIDEVHMLSVSAFNALLKTLEEPPEHVKFIMATTEPNKILATIQSRCQRFDFRNIRVEDIAGQLQRVLASEAVEAQERLVHRVARLARGSMRDGLSLLDQLLSMGNGRLTADMLTELLGTPRSERILEIAEQIGRGELGRVLVLVDKILTEGLAPEQLAEALQEHFRDLLVVRNCGQDTELVDMEDATVRGRLAEQARMFDDATLVYNITVMEELRRSVRSSGSGRPLLEAALVRLTASERFSDTKVLLEQLRRSQANKTFDAAGRREMSDPVRAKDARGDDKRGNPEGGASGTMSSRAQQQPAGTGAGAEGGLDLPDKLNLEYIQGHWPEILTALSVRGAKHLESYLRPARPMEWQEGHLTLGLNKDEGIRLFLSGQPMIMKEIEEALSGVLLRPVKIELGDVVGGAGRTQSDGVKPSPGAKPSQEEINAAMNDPQVRQVQQILGGKVRRIERLIEKNEG